MTDASDCVGPPPDRALRVPDPVPCDRAPIEEKWGRSPTDLLQRKDEFAEEWGDMVATFDAPDSVLDPAVMAYVKRMVQWEKEQATQREKGAATREKECGNASPNATLLATSSRSNKESSIAARTPTMDAKHGTSSVLGATSNSSRGEDDERGEKRCAVRVDGPDAKRRSLLSVAEKEQLEVAKKLLIDNVKGYLHMSQWLATVFTPGDSGWVRNRLKKHIIETFDEEKADRVRTFMGGLPIDEGDGGSTPKGYQARSHGTYPQWLDKFVHIKEWREVVYSLQKTKSSRLLTQVVEMISDRGFDREVQTAEGAASTTYIVFCRSVKAFFHDHFQQLMEGQYHGEVIKAQLAKFRKEWTLPYALALTKCLARQSVDGALDRSSFYDMEDELIKNVSKGNLLKLWFSCLGCYPDVFTLVANWIGTGPDMVITDPNDLTRLLDAVNNIGGQDTRGSDLSYNKKPTQDGDVFSRVDSFHMPAVSATGDDVHGHDSKRQVEGLGDALSSSMILRAIATAYIHLELTQEQRRDGSCLYDLLGYSSDMETVYHVVNNPLLSFTQKCRKLRKTHGHGAALASIIWLKQSVEKSPFSTWCVDSGKPLTKFLHCIVNNFPRKDIVEECLQLLRTLLRALFDVDERGNPSQCVYSNAQAMCAFYPQLGKLLAYILLETRQMSVLHFVMDIVLPQVDHVLIKTFVSVVSSRIEEPYSNSFKSLWTRFLHSAKVAEALNGDPKLRKMAKEYGSEPMGESDSDHTCSASKSPPSHSSDDYDEDDLPDDPHEPSLKRARLQFEFRI